MDRSRRCCCNVPPSLLDLQNHDDEISRHVVLIARSELENNIMDGQRRAILTLNRSLAQRTKDTYSYDTRERRPARLLDIALRRFRQAMEEDDVDNIPILLGLLLLNVLVKAGYMLVVYNNLPDRRWPTRAVKQHYHYGRIDRHNRVPRKTFTAAGVFRDISSSHFML
jgi:hypothetical protein